MSTVNFERIFGAQNWPSTWAHPYESLNSLYNKYAWINGLTENQYRWLRDFTYQGENRQALDARLLQAIPPHQRAPEDLLWRMANFPNAICEHCIAAGYHSSIPQMLGHVVCPLHNAKLIRHCKSCFQPLRFGFSQEYNDIPFVCKACSTPIAKFPGRNNPNWRDGPGTHLAAKFEYLATEVRAILSGTDGIWSFPTSEDAIDHRLVMNAITRGRLGIEFAPAQPIILNSAQVETVESVTFNLPMNADILSKELRDLKVRILSEIKLYCKLFPEFYLDTTFCRTSILKSELLYELEKPTYDSLRNILLSYEDQTYSKWDARKFLIGSLMQKFELIPIDFLHERRAYIIKQALDIVLSLSMWQALRVLLLVRNHAHQILKTFDDYEPSEERYERIYRGQRYGIRLLNFWRSASASITLNYSAWFSPYRISTTGNGVNISVFQIIPCNPQ